jgi:hypothetical protein
MGGEKGLEKLEGGGCDGSCERELEERRVARGTWTGSMWVFLRLDRSFQRI